MTHKDKAPHGFWPTCEFFLPKFTAPWRRRWSFLFSIGVFCVHRARSLWRHKHEVCGVFSGYVRLLCRHSWFECGYVGLFCGDVGLLCRALVRIFMACLPCIFANINAKEPYLQSRGHLLCVYICKYENPQENLTYPQHTPQNRSQSV